MTRGGTIITDAPDPEDRLSIDASDTDGGVALRLEGDLDPHTAGLFRQAVDSALERGDELTVDMRGVAFIDSSGLRVLADAQRILEGRDRVLVIRRASEGTRKLLELTGLAEYVRTEP